jgi:beta-barrel assembly-enhancing protease
MNKRTFFDFLKLLVIFGSIWAAFTFIPFNCNPPELKFSMDQEEKLGELIVNEIILSDKRMKVINDPAIDSAMNEISSRLLSNMGLTDFDYKIRVIENDQINAFTLPGGNIFVFTGLLTFAEHPEEVAAVLAHEIGHVENRHVINKLVKEIGISVIFSVLTGTDNILTREIGRTAASTVFDRKQEEEADLYALELLEKSNINPKALATFFRRLNTEHGSYNEKLEVFMTHPHHNSRIKASLEYVTEPDFKSKGFNFEWERVKMALQRLPN